MDLKDFNIEIYEYRIDRDKDLGIKYRILYLSYVIYSSEFYTSMANFLNSTMENIEGNDILTLIKERGEK